MFRAARAHDGKPLTDGEIMSALGLLIAGHCKETVNVTNWLRGIELTAVHVHAQKGSTKK